MANAADDPNSRLRTNDEDYVKEGLRSVHTLVLSGNAILGAR